MKIKKIILEDGHFKCLFEDEEVIIEANCREGKSLVATRDGDLQCVQATQ